jgi:hypothetical protein
MRSKMVNLPILRTIHRHFRSQLKEYEEKLTRVDELPVYLDRMVQQHALPISGVYLAVGAITCLSEFLTASEVKESNDSYMFLVNL